MKRTRKTLLLLAAVLLAAGVAFWLFRGTSEEKPRVIATAEVVRGDVSEVLEATGIVKPQVGAIVAIGAQATGLVVEMNVKVGDLVEKGQLIARIDNRQIEAQLRQARATLRRLELSLQETKSVYPLRISEAEAELESARSQLQFEAVRVERQRPLLEEDLIAREQFDEIETAFRVAKNQVASRKAVLERLRSEFPKQLAQIEEEIAETNARIQALKVDMSFTEITSPIRGYVSQVTVQEGETVVTGLSVANLVTVIDPTKLEMWIYVDETDIGQVRPGQPVSYRVDAYQDRMFEGDIGEIYPQPEIRDNIVYYRALVPVTEAQAEFLRPEMTTHCQIEVDKQSDVLLIPNAALKWVGGRQVVYVVPNNGIPEARDVVIGLSGLEKSEVKEGLSQGDTVATQIVLPGAAANPEKNS